MRVTSRGKANVTQSGFVTALTTYDGTTWVPEKNLHSDMIRTEYRNRFNKEKPFHKTTLRQSLAVLPRRVLVYD
jgi:hypothetical protein